MQTILLSIPPIRSSANGVQSTKQNFKTEMRLSCHSVMATYASKHCLLSLWLWAIV